jgi:hypothetical protein
LSLFLSKKAKLYFKKVSDDQILVDFYECCATSRHYVMKRYKIMNVIAKGIEMIMNIPLIHTHPRDDGLRRNPVKINVIIRRFIAVPTVGIIALGYIR